jgi:hypothetical protein
MVRTDKKVTKRVEKWKTTLMIILLEDIEPTLVFLVPHKYTLETPT